MIASHRFALLATSIFATLLLSACQPVAEDNQPAPVEESAPPVTDTTHAEHDSMSEDTLQDDADVTDGSQMTDILKDYKKTMTNMHAEMLIGMGYNDPDTAFAKGMLGHHRGAIDMAEIQLKYGTDEAMRQLAQDIITAQQAEIDVLNKWLASHPDAPKPKPNTTAMQQAYAKTMEDMHGDMTLGIATPMPDMAFARGMLPHHIGAVDMAKIQLKYGTDEEMRQLAQSIIDTQQAEIDIMQNWIAALQVLNSAKNSNTDVMDPESQSTENESLNSENTDNNRVNKSTEAQ